MSNKRWLFQLRSLPHAALAVAACAAGPTALAQNAANGQVLYQTRVNFPVSGPLNCEDCHGPAYLFRAASSAAAISGAIGGNRGGMSVYSFLSAAQVSDIAAYVATALPPPPPPPVSPPPAGSPPAATPMASPNPAMLPNTVIGSTSSIVNVQFTNTAAANVTFATPAIGAVSGDTADFLVAAPTTGTAQCISGRVMAPGTSCWFGVQFKPTAAGTRTATWAVNFLGSVAPRTLTMQGAASTTMAPAPAPAPAPTPGPAPAPAPAPSPSSANAPTSGGGGAMDAASLLGLSLLAGLAGARRRLRR
jgi:mono/diheme cytochrome c family protein